MTQPESGQPDEHNYPRDPVEEAQRVQAFVRIFTAMLADDHADIEGSPRVTIAKLSFVRLRDRGDMVCADMQEECTGTLLGLGGDGTNPTALLGNYEVWLHGENDSDDEPSFSLKLYECDLEEVPMREIGWARGSVGTAEEWEEMRRQGDS